MSIDPIDLPLIALVSETRAAREALHGLVARLQDDRRAWQRMLHALARRQRLTPAQRELFARAERRRA